MPYNYTIVTIAVLITTINRFRFTRDILRRCYIRAGDDTETTERVSQH